MKVRECNLFTGVCQSLCPWGYVTRCHYRDWICPRGWVWPEGWCWVCPGVATSIPGPMIYPLPSITKTRKVGKRRVRVLLECFLIELLSYISNMCRRAVSGIPSNGDRVGCGAMLVARESYYDEEYSVYLCGRASLLSLTAVHQFASYSV